MTRGTNIEKNEWSISAKTHETRYINHIIIRVVTLTRWDGASLVIQTIRIREAWNTYHTINSNVTESLWKQVPWRSFPSMSCRHFLTNWSCSVTLSRPAFYGYISIKETEPYTNSYIPLPNSKCSRRLDLTQRFGLPHTPQRPFENIRKYDTQGTDLWVQHRLELKESRIDWWRVRNIRQSQPLLKLSGQVDIVRRRACTLNGNKDPCDTRVSGRFHYTEVAQRLELSAHLN